MAVLAHLALADRPRTRDALADLLWPGSDPEHARGALRRTLSSLRTAIGPDLVEATRDHVRLVKGPGIAVDVDRFRDARERSDHEGAVRLFSGDFLEGFAVRDAPAFEDWAQLEGDALRRELVAALADLVGMRHSAGDLVGALAAARRWLSVDPLDEPAHRALIRLYAATGDRAAALSQYRDCARMLSRELGVDPLAETTQLYDQINRGLQPAPPAPAAVPARSTPRHRSPPLIGRSSDLAALGAAYRATGPDGSVLLIEGEAGIGKTRLAEEFLDELRRNGTHVLAGRVFEDESRLPYAPVTEALRGRLRDSDDWLARAGDRALGEAARLVPDLADGRHLVDAAPGGGPGAETRFLAGVWDVMEAAASGPVPGVVFVDDVHWADDATLGLLTYGLRRLTGRPLFVLLACRTPWDHGLRWAVSSAGREATARVLPLDRLGRPAVEEIVRVARPSDPDPAVARELWELTEGVPLLLVEYLNALTTPGDWSMPTGARELLRARLGPLSQTARQVVAAAAVLGRSFDGDTVRAVSGRTEDETVTSLEELVSRGLIVEGSLDYDFAHGLLRVLVYEETSRARRRLLHGRAAAVPGAAPAVVARHLQLAGRDDDAARAFREAGDRARQVFANAEALAHLQTALALGHPDVADLHVAIGELQTVMGDYAAASESLQRAAGELPPDERAVVEHRLGLLHSRRGDYQSARAHLQAALGATPETEDAVRAGIEADLSLVAYFLGDSEAARSHAVAAQALAESADDLRARCRSHLLAGMLATADGDTDRALHVLALGRELADRLGDHELRVAALNDLALAHRARNELQTAVELTSTALDLCAATGDRHHEAALHNNLADLLHASGRAVEAMEHLKAAVELFAEVGAREEPQPGIWKLDRW